MSKTSRASSPRTKKTADIPPAPLSKKKQHYFVYVVGFIAALAGLLFGIDVGIISGARPFIAQTFHLSTAYQEMIVSGVLYGAILGTLISGPISQHFGRRSTLLISAVIFITGALFSAFAPSPLFLLGARTFLGLAVGIASFSAPLYLSEVSPKEARGGLISTYQLMITIGILVAYLIDLAFSDSGNWRWMLGVTCIPAILLFVGVLNLPKSPRWLMLKGLDKEALNVLERIRHPHEVEGEANEIRESLQHSTASLWEAITSPLFLRVLLLGFMLQLIQQFTGINVLIYYSSKIYELAGYSSHTEQLWGTALIGLVNMLTTLFAIIFVDKFGRRPILFGGLVLMGGSLFSLSHLFHQGIASETQQLLVVGLMLIYIIGFAASLGPIIWILCAEIFPLRTRDIGLTGTNLTNWGANAMIGTFSLSLFDMLGAAGTFLVFAVICVFSLIFLFFFCPETKNISLEKIEEHLSDGLPLRKLGR